MTLPSFGERLAERGYRRLYTGDEAAAILHAPIAVTFAKVPPEMKKCLRRIVSACVTLVAGTLALVVTLFLLVVALSLYSLLQSPDYDTSHPDYAQYERIFALLAKQMEKKASVGEIDLAALNDGDWETACIFGGYTDPLEVMQSHGAIVVDRDVSRLVEAESTGGRMAQVEESEIMLTTIDRQNRAHFIHFKRGIGSFGQYLSTCISKPATTVFLNRN